MSKATREEVQAALGKYLVAREAALRLHSIDIESTPEWEALGVAYDHLQVVEKSFHSRRRAA